MDQNRKLTFIDYIVLIVKYKKLLLITVLLTGVLGYLAVYFFIDEQFDSTSVIIPAKDESLGGISGLLGDLQNLPLGLGGGVSTEEMGMYNTVIYSRTMLEKVIDKFNLIEVFELEKSDPEYLEKAVKILTNNITTTETTDFSYIIEVRAPNPQLSADMNNYLVAELNNKIVQLKMEKSKNNRQFLEDRVNEVKVALAKSEDTLQYYQEKTGMLEAEEQVKEIMGVYGDLETELITKQIEVSILKKLYPNGGPKVDKLQTAVDEYSKKLDKLKREGEGNSLILSLKSIPKKAIEYYRNFRNVEINSKILEFVLPLYEQAKFEEQKDVPILQVVDYAVPPAKKSYPPRTIFTLVMMFAVFIFCFFIILVNENENWQKSEKYVYVKKNILKWK
jgi:capsule polysaccharide export protein KpsE/RkpR